VRAHLALCFKGLVALQGPIAIISVSMTNIRLVLAYDGTDFHGWQRQPQALTIQEVLESALARITGERVKLNGSGRTDAGVHAAGQVANFETACPIPCPSLAKALNDILPAAIRVRKAEEVAATFHARYGAKSKTYRYRILQGPICPPFLARYVYHHPYPLDFRKMAMAGRRLEGEHDFTSFAGADPPDKGQNKMQGGANIRQVFESRIAVRWELSLVVYEIRGSGFLHHMVRNIVGTLLEVGNGKLPPENIPAILEARNRSKAGATAPARGLCLVRVDY
jgi:tRNA pseudouridine38-40 synthase